MRGLPQKQNARRADKIRLCGHLRRYKKIVKKTYIIYYQLIKSFISFAMLQIGKQLIVCAIGKEVIFEFDEDMNKLLNNAL